MLIEDAAETQLYQLRGTLPFQHSTSRFKNSLKLEQDQARHRDT